VRNRNGILLLSVVYSLSYEEEDNLELLPVMDMQILEFYPRGGIHAGTYAWQDKPVKTVAVKAVLISLGRLSKKKTLSDSSRSWMRSRVCWTNVNLDYAIWLEPFEDLSVSGRAGTVALM
jgi:hypothetical protein